MISRRISRPLMERLRAYVASVKPATTDTAVIELALEEYLDKVGA
jgi:hypothetical protein